MSYANVTDAAVRDLVHGAIFTRGPKDLHNTAIFIGGTDMLAGERLLAAVKKTVFGPMRVSVMLDSNGSNTTAVAAVAKLQHAVGDVKGTRAVITAGTGPVGIRAAGLLAGAGAGEAITPRKLMASPLLRQGRARPGEPPRASSGTPRSEKRPASGRAETFPAPKCATAARQAPCSKARSCCSTADPPA